MTPRLIHISIEQVLQNIDSNIYSSFKPKELDLHFNTVCDKFITYSFKGKVEKGDEYIFQDIQRSFDNIRYLLKVNELKYLTNGQLVLPEDFRDLINSTSLVNRTNCAKKVSTINSDKYYKNNTSVTIVYNSQNILTSKLFLGIEESSTFTYTQKPYTGDVIELIKSDNRLVETEIKTTYLKSSFTKPKYDSPVVELYGNNLKVYKSDDFKVEGLLLDYVRKLVPLDSSTPTTDWNTEFPDETIKVLIDMTVKRLLFIVESQKYQASTIELAK